MTVTEEMVIVQMTDVPAFAGAHAIQRLVRDTIAAAPPTAERQLLEELRLSASALRAAVAAGLQAARAEDEVKRYLHADDLLETLRAFVWFAFDQGVVAPALFDEIMVSTAQCRRHLDALFAGARRRARLSLEAA